VRHKISPAWNRNFFPTGGADVEGESQRADHIVGGPANVGPQRSDQTAAISSIAMELAPGTCFEGGASNFFDYFAEVLRARQ
jgi:hypothetical protein